MGKSKTVRMTRKKKKTKNQQIRCPYCGAAARYQSADGIYHDNSRNVMLYVCPNYPECDSYVRVHKGTKIPVGTMANKELRKLRKEAHDQFNKLYMYGYMTKDEAYRWLADIINTTELSNAHIGNMSEYYCKVVIDKSIEFIKARKRVNGDAHHGFRVIGGDRYETERKPKAAC